MITNFIVTETVPANTTKTKSDTSDNTNKFEPDLMLSVFLLFLIWVSMAFFMMSCCNLLKYLYKINNSHNNSNHDFHPEENGNNIRLVPVILQTNLVKSSNV